MEVGWKLLSMIVYQHMENVWSSLNPPSRMNSGVHYWKKLMQSKEVLSIQSFIIFIYYNIPFTVRAEIKACRYKTVAVFTNNMVPSDDNKVNSIFSWASSVPLFVQILHFLTLRSFAQ